jgi:hypothetical protein
VASFYGLIETRLIGALNAHTGAVQAYSCSQMSRYRLVEFYQQVALAYPGIQKIWAVQDNWSLHFHPDALIALEAQPLLGTIALAKGRQSCSQEAV